MKTVTVVPSDNVVSVDGAARGVDCTEVDHTIHAIQWNEEKQKGYIEFIDDDPTDNFREPNISIDSFAPYQWLVDAWEAAAPPPPEQGPDPAPGGKDGADPAR